MKGNRTSLTAVTDDAGNTHTCGGQLSCSTFDGLRGRPVGAGLPAKRPALLANFHPPFIVAAATVFAGKPANTGRAGASHRVGLCADMPAQSPRSVSLAPPASRARR
ncbi:hypothetical protein DM483_03760 [Pseudomonas sp. SMT-1]|nr:hypothetical protein DM483_03760 [Pseudomonas sp. SMT-1]